MKKKNNIFKIITGFILLASVGLKIKGILTKPNKFYYQSKNNDKIIKNIDYQLEDFDLKLLESKEYLVIESDVEKLQELVKNKVLTYTEIMAIYLLRIKNYDQNKKGLNAFITINSQAIKQAQICDKEKLNTSMIYGLPIALKDNINTNFIFTTAGTVALKDFIPFENALLVNNLINKGGIIIGKTNLSELANFMSERNPNGFSNLKGQNMNPYGPLSISTLGSSSGSAVAVSANFASISIGTETSGSIVAPSGILNVVGFRPTQDKSLIKGVVPLAPSLDMTGPITKNVKDALFTYNAMANLNLDVSALDANYLNNKKLLIFDDDSGNEQIIALLEKLKVVYKVFRKKDFNSQIMNIIFKEFKPSLNNYLSTYNAPIKSLQDLVAYNNLDKNNRAKYGQTLLIKALKTPVITNDELQNYHKEAKEFIDNLLTDEYEGVLFMDNTYTEFPCLAGCPELIVPLYIDKNNTPHGITIVTKINDDLKALKIGYAIEFAKKARKVIKLS